MSHSRLEHSILAPSRGLESKNNEIKSPLEDRKSVSTSMKNVGGKSSLLGTTRKYMKTLLHSSVVDDQPGSDP